MAFAVVALACSAAAHAAGTPTAPKSHSAGLLADHQASSASCVAVPTQAGNDGVAEEIFQNNFVSARSVAAFARNGQPVGSVDETQFDAAPAAADSDLFVKRNASDPLGPKGAARSSGRSKSKALLTFWADSSSAADAGLDSGISAEAAAAAAATIATGSGPSSVLIPLPAAAWSALSVMGGVSVMAGFRKIRRRFR
jgi:hypothetical protein